MEKYEREHLERLRTYLAECTVFLKKNADFPLAGAGKIALFGNGVRSTIKGGTGSGEVNSRFYHTVEEGFLAAGFHITTTEWLNGYEKVYSDAKAEFIAEKRREADAAGKNVMSFAMGSIMPEPEYELPLEGEGDTAIYVLARISGEGADRQVRPGDFLLTETEIRDINKLAATYPRFMLVLNVGGPVDLTPVMNVENILVLSQLGVETGDALASIVLGKTNPSGKLATTWSAAGDYCEVAEFDGYDDTRYKEGIYVGYRYFDSVRKTPMFPFGFGLSYTDFAISKPEVSVDGHEVTVKATVSNIGKMAGKEVVQVYVSVPEGELDQPYQTLAAFAKTEELAAGACEEVTLSFDLASIVSYDEQKAAYVLEKGDYIVRVGNSSRNTQVAAVIALDRDVTVEQAKNVFGKPDFEPADIGNKKADEEIPANVAKIAILADAFETKINNYDRSYEIDDAVTKLSDEELALLGMGYFWPQGDLATMVGNSGSKVAGTAGETSSVGGIPVITMADGPAGVRVCEKFFRDSDGVVHPLTNPLPASMVDFLSEEEKIKVQMEMQHKLPESDDMIEYQYATAIPIGTAIAQSFNVRLAEECGDIVGDEMERIGVHLWLAPALNIHRNVLCGRNFEYFSEDPLVSGKMAAAITRGVQTHKNCSVTIKHFAANNQELNRTSSNSQASERAIREIYLRGFEICVKEAAPNTLMTSYNLLNGVHTSQHAGLINEVLRNEWNYQGVVMTDWIIDGGMIPADAKYKSPDPALIAAAGGDLFMPGSQRDYNDFLEGIREGRVSREQLLINATRIYRLAKDL